MRKWWLIWALALACLPAAHGQSADELLPADQAFQFSAKAVGPDTVHVQWKIANQYHLYRKRVHISTDTPGIKLGKIDLPAGILEHDPVLGDSRVYRHQVAFNVPLQRSAGAPDTVHLIAKSQGCSDAVGVCYPPQTQTADVKLPPQAPAASSGSSGSSSGSDSASSTQALSKLSQLGDSLGLNDQGANEFLPPDQAFQFSAQAAGPDTLEAHWKIADGYYLYRSKFQFKLEDANGATLKQVELPPGKAKHDEFAGGTVYVFHHEVTARLPLARTGTGPTTVKLLATYQGCAEAGICYPPVHKTVALKLPAGGAGASGGGTASTSAAAVTATPTAPTTAPTTAPPVSEQDRIANSLAHGHLAVTIASFFGFGLLLAFTPCIFPMIPILSSIIVGQGETITTGRAFALSAAYVLAMAVTYTAAGIIAALFGQNLQAAFQDPWILGTFAAVFVLLSLSMFGFYDLQMPAFIQSKLTNVSNRQRSGTLLGSAVMGFLSALIVGPCVAAPLAGALIYIGQTGNAVLGGTALFALSLGMGAPLMVIGTGS
ncbi:MAG: protein-disulfide reductase DsbD, partial [Gammaproteobacteria bacterium]